MSTPLEMILEGITVTIDYLEKKQEECPDLELQKGIEELKKEREGVLRSLKLRKQKDNPVHDIKQEFEPHR